jgi:class 3 adenylate cyclase
MVFFNDPLPQSDHAEPAVRMPLAIRARVVALAKRWRREGHELNFGVGIAMGYATLGRIGFEGRFDYAAIGPVTNLAARLCAEAAGGEILITGRVHGVVEGIVTVEHKPFRADGVRGRWHGAAPCRRRSTAALGVTRGTAQAVSVGIGQEGNLTYA